MSCQALTILEKSTNVLQGWTCPSTAECCHFERTGREPYVTAAEWDLIQKEFLRQGRRWSSLRDDGACPFLSSDERCIVYAARPLGCRTFYCSLASGPTNRNKRRFRPLVGELESLSGDRGRPLRAWLRGRK